MEGQRNAGGTWRSGDEAEAFPREQASREGYLHDLSIRTQTQREELDVLRRKVAELSNIINRLERQLEETRMRQERPIQELTLRYESLQNFLSLILRHNLQWFLRKSYFIFVYRIDQLK